MNGVPRERVLALWIKLAQGQIDAIEAEPWLPGYYAPSARGTDIWPADRE